MDAIFCMEFHITDRDVCGPSLISFIRFSDIRIAHDITSIELNFKVSKNPTPFAAGGENAALGCKFF